VPVAQLKKQSDFIAIFCWLCMATANVREDAFVKSADGNHG